MALDKSEAALALSAAALVPSFYGAALPTLSELRGKSDNSGDVLAAEWQAAGLAGAVVLTVAVATRSAAVAGIGLAVLLATSCAYAHARNLPATEEPAAS